MLLWVFEVSSSDSTDFGFTTHPKVSTLCQRNLLTMFARLKSGPPERLLQPHCRVSVLLSDEHGAGINKRFVRETKPSCLHFLPISRSHFFLKGTCTYLRNTSDGKGSCNSWVLKGAASLHVAEVMFQGARLLGFSQRLHLILPDTCSCVLPVWMTYSGKSREDQVGIPIPRTLLSLLWKTTVD